MKILFDQGTPVPLREYLADHIVDTTYERGWSTLKNGDLLQAAQQSGYEVFVTTDQNLKYQQKITSRSLSIVVLLSTSWPRIKPYASEVPKIIEGVKLGSYIEYKVEL